MISKLEIYYLWQMVQKYQNMNDIYISLTKYNIIIIIIIIP